MKVAIVHDWLVTYAGSERVLEQIIKLYPDADVFAVVDFLSAEDRSFLVGKAVRTTFIQHLPFAKKHYRHYLPLMPIAIEQLNMSAYDLVISSSHAVAKGVITGPDQLHVSYVHSPIRYAWDLQNEYLREAQLTTGPKSWLARWILHRMRNWDVQTSFGVDAFAANSNFVARRIEKTYRRPSTVIYPPVEVSDFIPGALKEDFYLAASRMVPYKRIPLIIEAFNGMPDKKLVVVGEGPDFRKVRAIAQSNIELLGYQSTARLRELMRRARAFVFAAVEDFGIMPIEAQSCGTPVIAFGKGGATETVLSSDEHPEPTGVFFHEQSVDAIIAAVRRFEAQAHLLTSENCRNNAQRFSVQRFRDEFKTFVTAQVDCFLGSCEAVSSRR